MKLLIDFTDVINLKTQLIGLLQQLQIDLETPTSLQSEQKETRTEGEVKRRFRVRLSAHPDIGPGAVGIFRGDDGDEGYYLEFTQLFSSATSTDRNIETRTVWFEKTKVEEI
jgi:hypothetical protein